MVVAGMNLATQSYLDYLLKKREEEWERIRMYRRYDEGDQTLQLSEAQIELLVGEKGMSPEFFINICPTIIEGETEGLGIQGFQITDQPELTALVNKWWNRSMMNEGQIGLFYSGCRDGNSGLMVYHDGVIPRFAPHEAYDGEHSGVEFFYDETENGNFAEPSVVVKVWEVTKPMTSFTRGGDLTRTLRRNVYFPDRIEKQIQDSVLGGVEFKYIGWRYLQPGDPDWEDSLIMGTVEDNYGSVYEATYTPWDPEIGIPIVHFRRGNFGKTHGKSALAQVVPGIQDTINLSSVSLLAAAQLSGFKVIWATKFNKLTGTFKVYPGAILYNEEDGNFGQFSESNLKQLIDVKNTFIMDASMLTKTQLSQLNLTGDIPAAGTLRQLEAGRISKVLRNQESFGNSSVSAIRLALKLERKWGKTVSMSYEDIDNLDIVCIWKSPQTRNEVVDAEVAKQHAELRVPDKIVWQKLGYSEQEISQFASIGEATIADKQSTGRFSVPSNWTDRLTESARLETGEENVGKKDGNES